MEFRFAVANGVDEYVNRNRESWGTIVLLVLQYRYSTTSPALLSSSVLPDHVRHGKYTDELHDLYPLAVSISGGCFLASRRQGANSSTIGVDKRTAYSLRLRNSNCEMR